MAGRGSGYDDGYGYGFNEVAEYGPPFQPRRASANSPSANNGLSSRVSSVSDLGDPLAPPPDSYFSDQPNQQRQSQYSDAYGVSPPSRPVSQFEPFQSNMPGATNGYTVSPPLQPVSHFESFQTSPPRASSGGIFPSSQPTTQFEPLRPQPPRRYSSGRYSIGTPDLEEVDISHVRLHMTESPQEEYGAFSPPPISQSPSSGSGSGSGPGSRTPSTKSSRTLSWHPLNPYQPVGVAPPPPTPSSPSSGGRSPSTKQRWKSFRTGGRKLSVLHHQTINEEGGEEVELLQAASLPGGLHDCKLDSDHPPLDRTESVVDLSSFMYAGPEAPRDKETLQKYNELERQGYLTGGLGSAPATPMLRVTSSQLMESSPTEPSRMLTRRGTRMNRKTTVKNLAQREANKTGQVVEVIEEVAEDENAVRIDIGDGYTPEFRRDSLRPAETIKKIYYPRANWKPITMRWYYLTMLILVSAALGGSQEYLLWKSNRLEDDQPKGILRFIDPKDMPDIDFFSSKYLSTILTVAYGILWQLTDIEVKRLEAYYQLSKEKGALAAESINIDYVTLFDIFRPIVAMWYRHWAVAVSSVAAIMAVFVIPVLQSFTMELDPKRPEVDGLVRKIMIDPNWSRVLSFSLYAVSALGIALLLILQNRDSGLNADVKGIAGVTKMAARSHILPNFKDLDTNPPKEIHDRLKRRRYRLRNSVLLEDDSQILSSKEQSKYDTNPFKLDDNPHPFMMRLGSCLGLEAFMLFFGALVPILLFTPASVVSEKLPGLTTALAIALKFVLQTLEQDMRMMEPFFVLWKRHAPPKTLTLDYAGMAFGYMPIQAFINRDFLLAALGFGSVLTEVLTVCVSSLGTVSGQAFLKDTFTPKTLGRGQETPTSFWTSLIIVFVIMAYLMVVVGLVMIYRRNPFLPRQPSTIASVLAYVYQSKMLWHFMGEQDVGATVEESNNKMVKRLEQQKKTYGYGWFIGRDAERHCGVDEEQLLASYKFGKDFDHRQATFTPMENYEAY